MSNLRELRKAKKMTQTKLAKLFGVAPNTFSQYENGTRQIPDEIKIKMADYFNVTIDYLLGRDTTELKNAKPVTDYSITKLPIIGAITTDKNGFINKEDLGEIEVLDIALNGYSAEECFVLKVKGDSMYPLFLDNDLVLVHKQQNVDSGTIAVVIYNDNIATIKKVVYNYGGDWLDLVPTNPEFMTKHIESKDLDKCQIIGKVISLVLRKI